MALSNRITLWSDLNQNLVTDAQGNIKTSLNIDSVLTSIDNILRTYKGERVMLPSFASDLQDIVFENMTQAVATMIADSVKTAINTWDNRVEVLKVDLSPLPDQNQLQISVEFNVRGYTSPSTYTGIF